MTFYKQIKHFIPITRMKVFYLTWLYCVGRMARDHWEKEARYCHCIVKSLQLAAKNLLYAQSKTE